MPRLSKDEIESNVLSIVVDREYSTAFTNKKTENSEYQVRFILTDQHISGTTPSVIDHSFVLATLNVSINEGETYSYNKSFNLPNSLQSYLDERTSFKTYESVELSGDLSIGRDIYYDDELHTYVIFVEISKMD